MLQTVLEEDQKFFKLLELLGQYHEEGSVLVFVDKQEHADELMKDLLKYSYPCLSLHGGIDQFDRGSIISDFKNGNVRLLVSYWFWQENIIIYHECEGGIEKFITHPSICWVIFYFLLCHESLNYSTGQ